MTFSNDTKNKLVLFVASVLVIAHAGHIDRTLPEYAKIDLSQYLLIAQAAPGLSTTVVSPYHCRLLGPYIVGLLPINVDLGFILATSLVLIISAQMLYGFLRRQQVSGVAATAGVLLWMLNRHAFVYTAWNCYQIDDILGVLALIIGYRAMIERRWVVFALALVGGMLARETAVLLIPAAVAYAMEDKFSRRDVVGLAAGTLLCVATYVVLHLTLHANGGMTLPQSFSDGLQKIRLPETWVRIGVNAFLPFTLVPLILWRETRAFFRGRIHLVVFLTGVVASTFFGSDDERLMQPALFVGYWLIAYMIDQRGNIFPAWWKWLLLVGGFLAMLHHLYGWILLPSKGYSAMLSAIALILVTLGTWIAKRKTAGVAA